MEAKLIWRKLELKDIEALLSIADTIHPGLPERAEVFAERVTLFPEGCLALVHSERDEVCGYAISHPIRPQKPPMLDSLMGQLHPTADQYYIHDVAILPEHQNKGYAKACIENLLQIANDYATTGLVSVYGTAPFWQKHGFRHTERNDELSAKMRDYGEDAVFLERQNR